MQRATGRWRAAAVSYARRMRIREATGDDWPAIWRFMRRIVAAGETCAWDTDLGEQEARALWQGHVGLHIMHRRL
jgi:hypothetical protein